FLQPSARADIYPLSLHDALPICAVVEVSDVRPETKEQVESLGGRFLVVESTEEVKTEGGYAKEVSKEFLEKQQQLIKDKIRDAEDRKSTRLNSSHVSISYAVFCL